MGLLFADCVKWHNRTYKGCCQDCGNYFCFDCFSKCVECKVSYCIECIKKDDNTNFPICTRCKHPERFIHNIISNTDSQTKECTVCRQYYYRFIERDIVGEYICDGCRPNEIIIDLTKEEEKVKEEINVEVKEEVKVTNPNNECSICFENEVNSVNECGHAFCESCLKQVRMCPACRAPKRNLRRLYL